MTSPRPKSMQQRRPRCAARSWPSPVQSSLRTAMVATYASLVAAMSLALGVAPLWAGSPGRYDDYRQGVYLPYLDAPGVNDDIATLPHLRISFGARSYGVVMDTGSTGIVVSADKIPSIDQLAS